MNPTIEHNFRYHPPLIATGEAHAHVRAKAKELADLIDQLLPQNAGREKATAITHVETAMMWACAGIVRHSSAQPEGVNDGDVRAYPSTTPAGDWHCDVCGWHGRGAPVPHYARNRASRVICSGELKRIPDIEPTKQP